MLKIVHDGAPPNEVKERCCVCRTPTNWWYGHGENNVALCPECAAKTEKEELPTKTEWINKEIELNKNKKIIGEVP